VQEPLQLRRRRRGDGAHRIGAGAERGHDAGALQAETVLQRGLQVQAGADAVVQPDLDQPLVAGAADQTLRPLPRDAQFGGDLVLRQPADIGQPPRPGGLVLRAGVAVAAHSGLRRSGAIWKNCAKDANLWCGVAAGGSSGRAAAMWLPPVKRQTCIPAARAASIPVRLSSITSVRAGSAPIRAAACRNRSGAGLPRATWLAVNSRSR